MHATQVATPFDRPGWIYEEKVDGYRVLATRTANASPWERLPPTS